MKRKCKNGRIIERAAPGCSSSEVCVLYNNRYACRPGMGRDHSSCHTRWVATCHTCYILYHHTNLLSYSKCFSSIYQYMLFQRVVLYEYTIMYAQHSNSFRPLSIKSNKVNFGNVLSFTQIIATFFISIVLLFLVVA